MSVALQQPSALVKSSSAPRCLIILYHRINVLDSDPQLLAVSPTRFSEHLQAVKTSYQCVTIAQLSQLLMSKTLTKNTVVITFDDGYEDNFSVARPLLERFDVPATMFVTCGPCVSRTAFWWDELENVLLYPGILPEYLELSHRGNKYSWHLGDCISYSRKDFESHRQWNITRDNDPTVRHLIYRILHEILRTATTLDRESVLDRLSHWAQRNRNTPGACQCVTEQALSELRDNDLIEIGAHSVTHPVLSTLAAPTQKGEIAQSKAFLERLLHYPVESFAYPYGNRGDYTEDTVQLVKKQNFSSACANIPEVVCPGTDRYQLPRLLARDCDGDTFADWLGQWFGSRTN